MQQPSQALPFLIDLIVDMKDCDASAVTREATFDALELDSLDFVEVQVAVKKRFQVTLPQELFVNGTIRNIGQLADFIAAPVGAVGA